jgi:LuxR family maltose regulon positive regulatory protein
MWLAQDRVGEASDWARERGLSPEDGLSYLREFEHATLARILLAQHEVSGDPACLTQATGLLERLVHAAQQGKRSGSVIQLSVLQALACRAGGDVPRALAALERALALAEPEGHVRVFLDEGPAMTSLLGTLAAREGTRPHLRRLVAAGPGPDAAAAGRQGPVEPLSPRELEVLRLLDTDLDGPDIARRLFVSVNTVRTHTKNLYAKLGVNSRRAAVRRGHDLGLLTAAGGRAVPAAP